MTGLCSLRTHSSVGLLGMDSLLLSFADAKVSLIEYSIERHGLTTLSLHHYEKVDKPVHRAPPVLRVDPSNRCAACWFYNDQLALLPFKQENEQVPYLPSFVVLHALTPSA